MGQLAQVLRTLPPSTDPRVLVDMRTSDDAGVYQLRDDLCLVQTVDFFTPVVDDPYTWGAIAATNSLSDVYAMGATPITALNIAAFPASLEATTIGEVLRGAAEKCREAEVALLGGHTVEDPIPKFGLSVTGIVHPRDILSNAGARAGDVLVLTKPLGTGIICSGIKMGIVDEALYATAVASMTTLNRAAAQACKAGEAHAITDITGFGLLGHLYEMCRAASLGADIMMAHVPRFEGIADLRARGATTSAPRKTAAYLGDAVTFDDRLSPLERELLFDPQTSGGLLIAVAPSAEDALHEALRQAGVRGAATVGRVVEGARLRVTAT
jgi:selenide,water dikinase